MRIDFLISLLLILSISACTSEESSFRDEPKGEIPSTIIYEYSKDGNLKIVQQLETTIYLIENVFSFRGEELTQVEANFSKIVYNSQFERIDSNFLATVKWNIKGGQMILEKGELPFGYNENYVSEASRLLQIVNSRERLQP